MYIKQILFTLFLATLYSCANIVPPQGGPKDTTPPTIKSITPADSSLNSRPKKVEVVFNKFMELGDLSKELNISPLLPTPPTVQVFGKKVVIKLTDTALEENTTYSISLGNALKDNREGTHYPNFTYRFSTGDYFDSLSIKGYIFDAATGLPDTSAQVFLYNAKNFNDSFVLNKKPLYVTKVDPNGLFQFNNLPNKLFKVIALQSQEAGYHYSRYQDKIGTLQRTIKPLSSFEKPIRIDIFREENDSIPYVKVNNNKGNPFGIRGNNTNNKLNAKVPYRVLIDTGSKAKVLQELNQPLNILLHKQQYTIDKNRIYLSFVKDEVEVEASFKTRLAPSKLHLESSWLEDSHYTLRLMSNWAKDTAGKSLPPSKYQFKTKKRTDYGTITLKFKNTYVNSNYIAYLSLSNDSIARLPITDTLINIKSLRPANYSLQVIQDSNQDGKYTPGDYFLKRKAEVVLPHKNQLIVKAGWDHIYQFSPRIFDLNKPSKGKRIRDQISRDKTSKTNEKN